MDTPYPYLSLRNTLEMLLCVHPEYLPYTYYDGYTFGRASVSCAQWTMCESSTHVFPLRQVPSSIWCIPPKTIRYNDARPTMKTFCLQWARIEAHIHPAASRCTRGRIKRRTRRRLCATNGPCKLRTGYRGIALFSRWEGVLFLLLLHCYPRRARMYPGVEIETGRVVILNQQRVCFQLTVSRRTILFRNAESYAGTVLQLLHACSSSKY